MTEPTTERLARDLEAAGAPAIMIVRARAGYYDDYKSPLAFPETQLLTDARAAGLEDIAQGVMDGRWDGTREESDAWAASPEGQAAFTELIKSRPNRAQRRHPRR
jgi:hypothetical protein